MDATRADTSGEDERALLDWLATHDADCPMCGYGLRGLRIAKCPECAARLELTVGSRSSRLGAWLLCVLSPALGLGFDVVTGIIIAVNLALLGPPARAPLQPFIVMAVMFTLAAICAGCVLWITRRRAAFVQRTPAEQWWLAMLWFAGIGVGHAVAGVLLLRFVL